MNRWGQCDRLYLLKLLGIDSTLHGFGYAGIDSGEGMVLWRKSLLHRLIVDGTQVAHIERGGVGAQHLFFSDRSHSGASVRRSCRQR